MLCSEVVQMVRTETDHLDDTNRFRPSIDIPPSFNLTADNRGSGTVEQRHTA